MAKEKAGSAAIMGVKDTLDVLINFPMTESILLMANHGMGKSEVVKQSAEQRGCPCIDFRLSQNDVGDLKGMPFHVRGRTFFAPPDFMPITEDDAKIIKDLMGLTEDVSLGRYGDQGVLFLDEINRASREVQQAAFELVLDRRLNLRSLPDGWRVVGAINSDQDIYTVTTLEPAFLSRFFVIQFKPTHDEFFSYSKKVGVHPAVLEFLMKYPEFIDPSKEALEEASAQDATKLYDRRSWHKFSRTITELEGKRGEKDPSLFDKTAGALDRLTRYAAGYLGSVCAVKFRDFVERDYDLLNADVILNKWDKGIQERIETIVNANRTPELAAYNELMMEYFAKHKKNLTDKQKKNLLSYLQCVPNEVAANFWKKFTSDHQAISQDWYRASAANMKVILGVLANPNSADVKKRLAHLEAKEKSGSKGKK